MRGKNALSTAASGKQRWSGGSLLLQGLAIDNNVNG